MNPSPKQLEQFIQDNSLSFGLVGSPIGQRYALVGGSYNTNDAEEATMLEHILSEKNKTDKPAQIKEPAKDSAKLMARIMASEIDQRAPESVESDFDLLDALSNFISKVKADYGLSDADIWRNPS